MHVWFYEMTNLPFSKKKKKKKTGYVNVNNDDDIRIKLGQ